MNSLQKIWRKITLRAPAQFEEAGGALLVALGAKGVWVEAAGKEVALHVFFPQAESAPRSIKEIEQAFKKAIPSGALSIEETLLPEEEWDTAWQAHSVPVQRIGKRLLIVPPWRFPARNGSGREVIQIAPEMAFGTGTHPTTRNCLLFLEQCAAADLSRLIDIGSGSGILAIAAAKLGADDITAVEIDPVALRAARKNARLNQAASQISFRKTIPARLKYRWAVANLTAPDLLALFPLLSRKVEEKGKLILSGILKEEGRALLERYRPAFSLLGSKRGGDWMTFLLEKKRA